MPMRSRRPRGGAWVSLPAPLATGLALHALLGPRDDFEPSNRDPIAARDTQPVRAVVHARERALDVVDGLARACRQREVAFALDAHRVAFARLFVELRVALLALGREHLGLGLQDFGLSEVAVALVDQPFAQLLERARRERRRQLL